MGTQKVSPKATPKAALKATQKDSQRDLKKNSKSANLNTGAFKGLDLQGSKHQTKKKSTLAGKPASSGKSAALSSSKNVGGGPSKTSGKGAAKVSAAKTHSKVKGSKAVSSFGSKSVVTEDVKHKAVSAGLAKITSRMVADHASAIGDTVCREVACEGLSTSGGYCRLHYIKNWKKIKRKEVILREKKLNQYIEELVAKYPDRYIEAIRQDLANDKDFAKVIYDLDLDEGVDDFDVESGESVDSLIDTIKRDFDDDGEGF